MVASWIDQAEGVPGAMTMADDHNDDTLKAAEFVLGVMPNAERTAFARRVTNEATLRSTVAFWENHFANLAEQIAPVSPPPEIWDRLERRMFPQDRTAPASWWNNLAFWRGASLAALTGMATLAAVLYVTPLSQQPTTEPLIAEVAAQDGTIRLATLYDPASGILKINRVEGAATKGRSFELWLIEGKNEPVSLGVLPDTPKASIAIANSLRAKMPDATLAISDEPAGGSPTGQATGAVLAIGKIHSI
jgi:anti-sigma-K factor RskA